MSSVAIIDIGSTSVGGALLNVSRQPRGKKVGKTCVEITKAARHSINFQEEIDIKRFLVGMDNALKQTVAELQANNQSAPSRIICFLSSPFHASQTRLINHAEPKPFTVTPRLVADLMLAELEKFSDSRHEIIENKIMQIKLNGYPTTAPYRKRASELSLANFVSVASHDTLERFQKIIIGGFHQSRIEWHSFAFTFFNILSEFLGQGHDFLLLDIGGEITELSLSWRSLLWNTASFPLGRNALVRQLARELGTTNDEAASSLQLYLERKQQPMAAGKVERALGMAKEKWLSAFRESLSRVVDGAFLPANIYLVGDLLILPLFKDWLTAESFDSFTISDKKLSVSIIEDGWLDRFCDHGASTKRDLSIMVEAIFCDKLLA
ncbi:MAG: hypothetical protein HYT48_02920 [Candidatus Vogelbacteria bacterium]|nr:hypothetical protein [Candidatus Vogelbacteria bacterium]